MKRLEKPVAAIGGYPAARSTNARVAVMCWDALARQRGLDAQRGRTEPEAKTTQAQCTGLLSLLLAELRNMNASIADWQDLLDARFTETHARGACYRRWPKKRLLQKNASQQ